LAKPEWGTKRMCLSCGARFYDFGRAPIVCPACNAVFDAESVGRARRARSAARPVAVAGAAVVDDPELAAGGTADAEDLETDVEVDYEEAALDDAEESEEDESLIEDASELGEDEDDVGEVIDGVDEEDHR
jgi:uncharacterized protein (TIGR02300 family)